VPPCLAIALVLLEARLAADQGVRRLVLSYGLLGNVVQDAAALQVLREMATEELNADGGIDLYVGAAEWSGQVPDDEGARYGVVLNGAIAAGLGGADIMSTAPVGTPRSADAAAGAQTTRQLLDLLTGQQLETSDELGREADLTRRSARAILDAVADAGDGDLARGTALAVRRGILDLPFGGNRHLAGVARAVRDGDGRLRWLEPGGVPIPADARDLHAAAAANAAELPPTELVSAGFFVPPGHSPEAGGGVTT
jgi:methylaspartate mutase epsilon subunit